MRRNVVIVGDSPLSLLVARALDQELARSAHIDVAYLSRDERLLYWPELTSLLGTRSGVGLAGLLKHVSFKKAAIKQINLIDRRVITSGGIFDYDFLFLDLTPIFTPTEVGKISQQCRRLVSEVQAKLNTGQQLRSRVTFAGEDVHSWQLATALASDLLVHSGSVQRSIIIQAQFPSRPDLKQFLAANNVASRKTVGLLPGLTIGEPTGSIKSRLVRGALLDGADNFILRPSFNPEGHPNCLVVDGQSRLLTNLWRVDQTLAGRIADNIERFLAGNRQKEVELPKPAGVIKGADSIMAWVGSLESRRWRARAIAGLDRRFYHRIVGKS